jgi:hypothetical protein
MKPSSGLRLVAILVALLVIAAIPNSGLAQQGNEAGVEAAATGVNATSSGTIGPNFFISSDSTLEEVSPSVAYNSDRQEYLVVWHNDRAGNDDIRAQRVFKDGTLAGSAFYIQGGLGADRRYPDVTYNSQQNEYLVVWEHFYGTGYSILGQRVSATGQLEGGAITIAIFSSVLDHHKPAVGYASTEDKYLVVWQRRDWTTGTDSIGGQSLSSAGALVDYVDIDPGSPGAAREAPDLAYNRARNEFLVVWQQEMSAGDHDVYGRRVKMSGGAGAMASSFGIFQYANDEFSPAVGAIPVPTGMGQYLVACVLVVGQGDIWVVRISGDENLLGSYTPVSPASVDRSNPAVVGKESSQEYLVTWSHPDYSPPFIFRGIVGRAISTDGDLLGEETPIGGITADNSAVASGAAGDYMVLFDDQTLLATPRDIFGQLWGNRVYLPLVVRSQ